MVNADDDVEGDDVDGDDADDDDEFVKNTFSLFFGDSRSFASSVRFVNVRRSIELDLSNRLMRLNREYLSLGSSKFFSGPDTILIEDSLGSVSNTIEDVAVEL